MASPGPSRPTAGTMLATWSAKALLIAGGVTLVAAIFWYSRAATVPLIIAALIVTQLSPLADWMAGRGLKRSLAVGVTMLGLLALALGLTWLFADSLFEQLSAVGKDIGKGADMVVDWLRDNSSWAREHEQQIRDFLAGILPAGKEAASGIFNAVLGGLSFTAQVVGTAVLTLVFVLYLMTGGDAVWRWITARFAPANRGRVAGAGAAAWHAAGGYVRGIALVAFIDSAVIGLGMLVIGTPHAGTLVLLSFISLFVPILGAWVSGIVIVLVTLAAQGSGAAAAMAAIILIAQQLDSAFVTPLVYQQTVNLHPIVTLTGVIVGSQLLGIVGAFLAVPMIAVGWAVYKTLEE